MNQTAPTCPAHPDEIAPWVCQECKQPLCDECRVKVQGKSACKPCAEKISLQTGAAIEMSDPAVALAGELPNVVIQESPSSSRILVGIAAGGVAGLIGAVAWEKIFFYTHHSFSFIYIGIGIAVGFCVAHFGRQEGPFAGVIAALLYSVTMFFGHHLYAQDAIGKAADRLGIHIGPLPLARSWHFIQQMFRPTHWFLVAFGLIMAYGVASTRINQPKKPT